MKRASFPGKKSLALLLDPDKSSGKALDTLLSLAEKEKVDYILAGGSITFNAIDPLIDTIKRRCKIPVFLFPGNLLQLTTKADGVLFLSLISGRNPELLIGNHVIAAPFLKDIRHNVVSAGYILISCGSRTSVEYMSQTEAIPADKHEIIVATALAGEMLGLKVIYLEGGSGAFSPVPPEVIKTVKKNTTVPLLVGGGIRTAEDVRKAYDAGADMVILGNGCEKNPSFLREACNIRNKLRKG
ncbi:MAG: geranylgeranylglyceryl/heptaprenylglyceryl phosphate synthase [Bacteroidales bacterium]